MFKYSLFLALSLILILSIQLDGQQRPDLDFEPVVSTPRYETPSVTICFDTIHHNLHKPSGGFAALARLLKADGYRISEPSELNDRTLDECHIFIIANPLNKANVGRWIRPILSAYDKDEIACLDNWVSKGGRLLVIADHMPFAGAAAELAQNFGFRYFDGFVMAGEDHWPPETYRKSDGTLKDVFLTQDIDSLAGFTGSALDSPEGALIVANFPKDYNLYISEEAWVFDEQTEVVALDSLEMGAVMPFGKGKLAFFTEAAMFTAQIVQDRYRVGFNMPGGYQNQSFILKLIHWLDD